MALTTKIKQLINGCLNPLGYYIESTTIRVREQRRLKGLAEKGYFDDPVFSPPRRLDQDWLEGRLADLTAYRHQLDCLAEPQSNDVGYGYHNSYFASPDADLLYCTLRHAAPKRYVEVGSGNSTRVARQAVLDGDLQTRITCIDPFPRIEVSGFADEVIREPVEAMASSDLASRLEPGDVLFIDSSHYVDVGSDVVFLFLQVLPRLCPGVLIHIHDIFLPFEYPEDWVLNRDWDCNEQYLLQAMLEAGDQYDVLWPGYFLQQRDADFAARFPHMRADDRAQSYWIRKVTAEAGSSA